MKYQYRNLLVKAEFSLLIGDQEIYTYFQKPDYLLMLWNNDQDNALFWVDDKEINLHAQ